MTKIVSVVLECNVFWITLLLAYVAVAGNLPPCYSKKNALFWPSIIALRAFTLRIL